MIKVKTKVIKPLTGPVEGAVVTVYDVDGSLASIYSDAGGLLSISGSQIATDASGLVEYYVAPGAYFHQAQIAGEATQLEAVLVPEETLIEPGGGTAATNLSYAASPTGGTVISDTGTDATLPLADATNAGLMAPAQHTKLGGIADGATANTGTVTSVAFSAPPGFAVTGSPITGAGTLALAFHPDYSLPTTAAQTQWSTAYSDRLKWDGGATGLTAATGRASLGLGTAAVLDVPASGNAASNQVVLGSDTRLTGGGGGTPTNLSYTAGPTGGTVVSDTGTDATLPLVDATNAGLMAPAQHTKLAGIADGATANTGTVTSVSLSVPTGFSVSGSPVTGSGTLAITYASGYSVPTTTAQGQWDTAYADRLKWDGGATGLNAATGRTSLGLGTAAVLDVPASGNAASGQVVKGDDTRLTDTRTPTDNTVSPAKLTTAAKTYTMEFIVGDGATVITAGEKKTARVRAPRGGTFTGWALMSLDDTSGSITFDVWKSASYPPGSGGTITAAAKPAISSATAGSSSTLTGWTTTFSTGDYFSINVDSVASVKTVKLVLTYTAS